ncbi:MAG TPA: glycosyltransferase family 2 protein [Candidatus Kapabacteria bacterium]|nr:glycosyltransferase family 2 protein [Candidatus Kapabacteria bacterium]
MDNTTIEVSVFISCYNNADYVAQAIESVLSQKTQYKYEIVVCDDASQDNSKDIILEYQRKYPEIIRAIIYKENIGLIQNFLNFIKIVRGKFVAFCEADDWWVNDNKIEEQVTFLINNPDYTLVFGKNYIYHQVAKELVKHPLPTPEFTNNIEFLMSHLNVFFIHTSTVMTTLYALKSFTLVIENYKRKLFAWDYPFFFFAPSQGKIKFLNTVYSVNRKIKTSITSQINTDQQLFDFFYKNTYNCYFYLMKKINYPQEIKQFLYYKYSRNCILYGIKLDNIKLEKRGVFLLKRLGYNIAIINCYVDLGFELYNKGKIEQAMIYSKEFRISLDILRTLKVISIKNKILYYSFKYVLDKVKHNKLLIKLFFKG